MTTFSSSIGWTAAALLGLLACTEGPASPAPDEAVDAGDALRIGHAPDPAETTLDELDPDQPAIIVDPTPVGSGDLTGMVQVFSSDGTCSGMVIGPDTVLTAAHCVCTHNWSGGNTCEPTASVTIRPNPNGPPTTFSMSGSVSVIPGYNPSWMQQVIQEDLAVIKLTDPVPSWAKPFQIAQTYRPRDTLVRIAGFGLTGGNCTGSSGTLNSDLATFDDYEHANHEREVMRFDDEVYCAGDSGGAILDPVNEELLAVNSLAALLISHGWTNKSVTTTQHHNWIKSHVCVSSAKNTCSGWGSPCACSASNSVLWQAASGTLQYWFMVGGLIDHWTFPATVPANVVIQGNGDFNGDGYDDLLLRHTSQSINNGQLLIWHMYQGSLLSSTSPGAPSQDWQVQGVADFDGNGRADILWRHTNGQLAIWPNGSLTGALYPGWQNQSGPTSTAWDIQGLGDFNGDGKADILWRNDTSTGIAIWFMSGGTYLGEAARPDPGIGFTVAGIGSLDGNTKADVVWRHGTNGSVLLWPDGEPMATNHPTRFLTYQNQGSAPSNDWVIQGLADVNHDGRDDIVWRQASTGQIAVWIMNGARWVADTAPATMASTWTAKAMMHDDNN